jgi:alpha-glucosidase
MTINQTIEGLFTPRYETYDLKIIGLPFAPSKVLIDGREFTDNLELDDLKRLRIKSSKSFKRIEILA